MDEVGFEFTERLLTDAGFDKGVGRRPIFPTVRGAEQHGVTGSSRGIGLEAGLRHLDQNETLILARLLEGIPASPHRPQDDPRDHGLEEDLGGHPDIVDDRLTTAGP